MQVYTNEELIVEMRYQMHLVKNSLKLRNVSEDDLDYLDGVLANILDDLEMLKEGI